MIYCYIRRAIITVKDIAFIICNSISSVCKHPGGGVLSYMGHIGMCRCEGYGFQSVYSSIGYINQSVWV